MAALAELLAACSANVRCLDTLASTIQMRVEYQRMQFLHTCSCAAPGGASACRKHGAAGGVQCQCKVHRARRSALYRQVLEHRTCMCSYAGQSSRLMCWWQRAVLVCILAPKQASITQVGGVTRSHGTPGATSCSECCCSVCMLSWQSRACVAPRPRDCLTVLYICRLQGLFGTSLLICNQSAHCRRCLLSAGQQAQRVAAQLP
jgi:hypothetical protein